MRGEHLGLGDRAAGAVLNLALENAGAGGLGR
jgi:hypothetical protein